MGRAYTPPRDAPYAMYNDLMAMKQCPLAHTTGARKGGVDAQSVAICPRPIDRIDRPHGLSGLRLVIAAGGSRHGSRGRERRPHRPGLAAAPPPFPPAGPSH